MKDDARFPVEIRDVAPGPRRRAPRPPSAGRASSGDSVGVGAHERPATVSARHTGGMGMIDKDEHASRERLR
jgi:hypothetical protein